MTQCSNNHGIAVDIGTTTIGMALVDRTAGAILAETGFLNPQKKHGADVASRIRYGATREGAKTLGFLVKQALLKGIVELENDVTSIKEIVISANTTMQYLFMERETKELGEYPFLMKDAGFQELSFEETFGTIKKEMEEKQMFPKELDENVFSLMAHCKVILLPCISTFVGGDITSGLYYLQFPKEQGANLLLDLGTNGEMAISGERGFYGTSVPAGPAFEASLRGQGRRGAALIEWIARARCRGQVLADGAVARRYENTGIPLEENLLLTQDVLRKIQLAKGALMAGVELLLKQYEIEPKELKKVYLAGSFGFHLDVQSAVILGMLPSNFQGKIEIVGNTSLKGAVTCLCDNDRKVKMEQIVEKIQPFNLAETEAFRQLFIERMAFSTIRI